MTFPATFQQGRNSALEPAVIFPAILGLLRHRNFIGVRFIGIDACLRESGESMTLHTCFGIL